jgi:arginine-tRNA-protein transferase
MNELTNVSATSATGEPEAEFAVEDHLQAQIHQHFEAASVPAPFMDVLWSDGWRHFGAEFFRTMVDVVRDEVVMIEPLRIDVTRFAPSKSQRRIQRKNAPETGVRVAFEPVRVTAEHTALFERHCTRFRDNVPDSLYTFLSDGHASMPCQTLQCCVYERPHERESAWEFEQERLIAVSYIDLGDESISSLYAMFDPAPEVAWRSLGIFTMLCEIDFARHTGRRYVYLGYSHPDYVAHSAYAYKRQFAATEGYDWHGNWTPIDAKYKC